MSPRHKPRPKYTLEQYAADKKLDVESLRELGLTDDGTRVIIPYKNEVGDTVATRYRLADGFAWEPGSKPTLYGLERLDGPPITLVEGESDAHTLAAHGVPVLALPGANIWEEEWAVYFRDPFFVVVEPDQGGRALLEWLRFSSVRDRANLIQMEAGAKDPSALYLADPEHFREQWTERIQKAKPWEDGLGWPDPVELGLLDSRHPAPVPIDAFPDTIRRFIVTVADSTQTPTDLPALVALAVLAAATANKYQVTVKLGFSEPMNLYCCVVALPAHRKSPVFKHVTRVLYDFEAGLRKDGAQERQRDRNERDILEQRLKNAKRKAASADAMERIKAQEEAHDLQEELDATPPICEDRLVVSNPTPEKLIELLAENDERIALLTPESVFGVMVDPYSKSGPRLDVWKKAWDGEPFKDDRIGRNGPFVRDPALTIATTCQPVVLETLQYAENFRHEGLLGRFLWAMPESKLGKRATGSDVPGLDPLLVNDYERLIKVMLRAPVPRDESGRVNSTTLELSDDATAAFNLWEAEVERMLVDDLQHLLDWAGKLVGHTVRIAGLFHLAQHAEQLVGKDAGDRRLDATLPGQIGASTMQDAIAVARALIPHARAVFGDMERRPELAVAGHVLNRILEHDGELTKRDLFRLVHGKREIQTTADLDKYLAVLDQHNQVAVMKRPSTGGQPPSPYVFVNPKLKTLRGRATRARSTSEDG